jgi:hypothetical protein
MCPYLKGGAFLGSLPKTGFKSDQARATKNSLPHPKRNPQDAPPLTPDADVQPYGGDDAYGHVHHDPRGGECANARGRASARVNAHDRANAPQERALPSK